MRFAPGLLLALLVMVSPARAEWQAVERSEFYRVRGNSGIELYEAIGHGGPVVGGGIRAIAHTNFKLTWRRDYQRRANSCVLATAVPKLIITYTLPKPAGQLPVALAAKWQVFADGIAAHEKVHGQQIVDMVRKIEAATVGLTEPDDPGCKKIRKRMTGLLGAISDERRKASSDFDAAEMGDGGAIRKLILALVNGG